MEFIAHRVLDVKWVWEKKSTAPAPTGALRSATVRALVVSNMLAGEAHPERGRFVRDQVSALRALEDADLEVELYEFAPGPRALGRAARDLRRRYAGERFDVVHAHFGLTAWPALAVKARGRALTLHGTDVRHPRTRVATRAALPTVGLLAAVSDELVGQIPGARNRARAQVLPCGVDMTRFRPIPRAEARAELGLEPQSPYLLFPADPARQEKHHDRAVALARALGTPLLTLGGVEPERVPLYVNAANAVLVPSEREGFGLAVLEALACDVPVLATPVGIHPQALGAPEGASGGAYPDGHTQTGAGMQADGLAGTLCAPFELERWRAVAAPHVAAEDPRVAGRERAERFSATRMAERVADAWRSLVADAG
jgi:teichuronic acid biosynthesis glycosyltransferase TuaC